MFRPLYHLIASSPYIFSIGGFWAPEPSFGGFWAPEPVWIFGKQILIGNVYNLFVNFVKYKTPKCNFNNYILLLV
jgi:hypothetical protein